MRRAKGTWRMALATALVAVLAFGLIGGVDAARQATWFTAWGFSQQGLAPDTLTNATVRMITRPTLAGTAVRVTIENTFGTQPLVIGAAYVGQRTNGALLVAGSNQVMTFLGASSVTIPPGARVVSDPVAMNVQAMEDVAVSLYLPGSGVQISRHTNARVTSYATAGGSGNHASEEAATAFT